MLAGRRPGRLDRLVKPAAEARAPLRAALGRLGEVAREQEQAVRGALLEEALAPAPEADRSALPARAAAFGVDFAAPARVLVLGDRPGRVLGDLAPDDPRRADPP